jgi:hypothetical protein
MKKKTVGICVKKTANFLREDDIRCEAIVADNGSRPRAAKRSCASKGCQCGLQNLPILLESREMPPRRHSAPLSTPCLAVLLAHKRSVEQTSSVLGGL